MSGYAPSMPRALVDLASLDLTRDVMPEDDVRAMLPHRHEFQMVDGICHLDLEAGTIVGYKDLEDEPWWAKGHIPGRPLMPGVLLIEGAAQLTTILIKLHERFEQDVFIGLGGLENARFRGQVTPPARIHFASRVGRCSGRRIARYPAEAYDGDRLVMNLDLLGVIL